MKQKRIISFMVTIAMVLVTLVFPTTVSAATSSTVDGFYLTGNNYCQGETIKSLNITDVSVSGKSVTVKVQVQGWNSTTGIITKTYNDFSCTKSFDFTIMTGVMGWRYIITCHHKPGHIVQEYTGKDNSFHYGKCKFCGTFSEEHVYDNNCDTICNLCGYERTIEHDYYDATCLNPRVCKVCYHQEGEASAHSYQNGYCTACGTEQAGGKIHIKTAAQLTTFAHAVKCGFTSLSAVLDNDIDISACPDLAIGTSGKPYAGTFDGRGHTVKVELGSKQYAALFPFINGATIKNLNTDGNVTTSESFASGLVGAVLGGNATIENCLSFVKINSSVSGDGTHGGLVANVKSGSLTINNSGFMGSITGDATANCGGLVGWAGASVKVNNCFVGAEFKVKADKNSNTISRNPNKVKVNNCYYVNALGKVPSGAAQVSAEQIASGELAYRLNGSLSGGNRWYQNLDNGKTADAYPLPDNSHGVVYYGYKDCETEIPTITNTVIKKTIKGHNGGEANCLGPAICADCGTAYKQLDPNTHRTTETYYAYVDETTHEERYSCCNAVAKTEAHSGTKADCLNNAHCDVCNTSYGDKNEGEHKGEQKWVDTGNGTHEYKYQCCGVVTDTQPHDVTCTADDETDTITVTCETCSGHGTVKLNVSDKVYDGEALGAKTETDGFMNRWKTPVGVSVSYCCEDGCKTAKEHTITMKVGDATVTKTVTVTKRPLTISEIGAFSKTYDMTDEVLVNNIMLDGVVVYEKGVHSAFDIKDSVAVDMGEAVVATESSLPGDYDEVSVKNITLIGSDKDNYSIASSAEGVTLSNTYGGDYQIYRIQIWITPLDQTLYGDDAVLDQTAYTVDGLDDIYTLSGEFLYEDTTLGKIRVNAENIKITYGDENVKQYFDITAYTGNVVHYCANHTFNENGFCSTDTCTSYEKPALNDNDTPDSTWDDYYEIENAGQLYWFARQVNEFNDMAINGVLTEDISVNSDLTANADSLKKWTPIGKDYAYTGAFDGRNHTVSGLYFNDEGVSYVGLFGRTDYNNTIQNINVSNSYFKGQSNVGALMGYAASNISNCSADSTVTLLAESNVGGLVGTGADGTMKNCMSAASVPNGDKFMGGLVGYSYLRLSNCYTTAQTLTGYTDKSSGSETNSYYLAESDDGKGGKTAEQFENGGVAYLLQSGVEEIPAEGHWDENWENWTEDVPAYVPQIWGQEIGTEKFPTFSKAVVYEDTYNNAKVYRNEIKGFKILLLGADKKSAAVVLDKAGTYTIFFADYEGGRLANAKKFSVTVGAAQAVRVTSTEAFTLGKDDKIMLLSGDASVRPLCSAFVVK